MTAGKLFISLSGLPPAVRLAGLLFISASSGAVAADYDILYLRHADPAKVSAYKAAVARILGPDVALRLREVGGKGSYALIYERHGGADSAKAVADSHSRLLTSRGLEPAVRVPSQAWASPESAASAGGAPAAAPAAAGASALESDIESYIKGLRRSGQIKANERSAWLVYDFKSDKKLVSINEELPLEAASLIKPFIAMAYLHEAEAGRKPYNDDVRGRLERMIQESDNSAADWVMRRLGGPRALQDFLKREYGGIFRNTSIVEYIHANGRTYRNKASARDYSRFLYALWNGVFPRSSELKRIMNLPNADRFYTSAPGVPSGTAVYDKTGTTSHLCGDMGILVARRGDGESFPYIVVGVIEKDGSARSYFNWMRSRGDIIRRVSEITYEEISGRYRFADFDRPAPDSRTAGNPGAEAEKNEGG